MFNYVIFLDDCVRICFHHWNRHSVFIYGLIEAIHYLNVYSSVFVKCEINWMQTAGMPISIFIGGRASQFDQIVQIFKYVIWSVRFKSVLQFLFHFMCLVWSCNKSDSIEIGLNIKWDFILEVENKKCVVFWPFDSTKYVYSMKCTKHRKTKRTILSRTRFWICANAKSTIMYGKLQQNIDVSIIQ